MEVDVNQLLEGRTEAAYWNMSMGNIYSVEMGAQ
jgi:hypothetical protein